MKTRKVSKLEALRLRVGITARELARVSGYCRQHVLRLRQDSLPKPLTARLRRDIFAAMKQILEARAAAGDRKAEAVLRKGFIETDLF